MLDALKGKRFWLFVVIGLIGFVQAVQPMIPEQWADIATGVLAVLGAIKTFFPYTDKSGEIIMK